MASIGLFVVGSQIGASIGGTVAGLSAATIGGAIGGAVGSYIDANFLFPPTQPNVSAPRVDDYSVQISSEGGGINMCYGPENKCTGSIIWIGRHDNDESDLTILEERKSTQKVGGKGGSSGGTQTTYSYYADLAIAIAEGEVNAIRIIWADSKVIYTTGVKDSRYEEIYLHTGSENAVGDSTMTNNSSPNSHIEAFEGAGNVPKYKGISYFVLDSFQVDDWGRRIPTFNALVERVEQASVANVIGEILERAGLTSAQYDVSRVQNCLTGYYVTGPIQSAKVLEPILQAYDILVAEIDSVIHFFHRGDEQHISITFDDLGSIDGPFPAQFEQIMDYDKPSRVAVNYIDANNQYDRGQELIQLNEPVTENQDTIDLSLVLTPVQAATSAARRLYRAQIESLKCRLRLPPSYIHVTEGDVLDLTVNDESYELMVIQKDRGTGGSIEIDSVLTDGTINTITANGSTSQDSAIEFLPYVAPELIFDAFSIPALIDDHALIPHYLVAATTQEDGVDYRGAVDYESPSNTTASFSAVGAMPGLSVMGTVNDVLGGGVSPDVWDNVNTINVTIYRGTLESKTQEEVVRGANHCLVGNEIIGFTTATLTGTNQYTLSELMRGRRHTFDNIEGHTFNESFILLDSSSLLVESYPPSLFGSTRYHRVVAAGAAVADVTTSDTVLLDGDSVKPFSPTLFTSSRDGSNNLTIEWTRRTRAIWDSFSAVKAPIYEGQEVYEIDILASSGSSTIVRTITVTSTTTASYTAVEQTSDGLTPGNPVYAVAYMVDLTYGRGWSTEELTL